MVPIKITLTFERSTKRYHVYQVPAGTIVPERLYLPAVDGQEPPQEVTVTIEA